VAGFLPEKRADPVVRFETEPQVDWAVIGRGGDRLSVFVATLGWSRSSYVEFCDDEKVETLILAHEHAFAAFGGVPREVLYEHSDWGVEMARKGGVLKTACSIASIYPASQNM
jgi:transposase